MAQWIRSSGLTQEEAAMIQPAYPVFGITSFDALTGVFPELADGNSGLTLSDLSVRRTSFSAALPASFQTTPNAIDAIFEQGKAELDNSSDLTQNFLSNSGVLFGANGTGGDGFVGGPGGTPTNLDDWLYFGPNDAVFGGLVFGSSGPNNVGIIEIEYQIRSQDGEAFSDVGFSSANEFNGFDFPNQVNNTSEQNALLLLSEIYQGDSNELLGEHEFFVAGSVTNPSLNSPLFGTGLTSVSEDFLRIKTYGLAVGDASIDRVFNEFTAVQVPEPSSGIAALLFGAIVIRRRNRRLALRAAYCCTGGELKPEVQ